MEAKVVVDKNSKRQHTFLYILLSTIVFFNAADLLFFIIGIYTGTTPFHTIFMESLYLATKLYVPCVAVFIWIVRNQIVTKKGRIVIMFLVRFASYAYAFVLTWHLYGIFNYALFY